MSIKFKNKQVENQKEEEKDANVGVHSKKKLESPKLPENRRYFCIYLFKNLLKLQKKSPSLKKKNSRTHNNNNDEYQEYNDYWEQHDEINHNIYNPIHHQVSQNSENQENNIMLPNLPLTNNPVININFSI